MCKTIQFNLIFIQQAAPDGLWVTNCAFSSNSLLASLKITPFFPSFLLTDLVKLSMMAQRERRLLCKEAKNWTVTQLPDRPSAAAPAAAVCVCVRAWEHLQKSTCLQLQRRTGCRRTGRATERRPWLAKQRLDLRLRLTSWPRDSGKKSLSCANHRERSRISAGDSSSGCSRWQMRVSAWAAPEGRFSSQTVDTVFLWGHKVLCFLFKSPADSSTSCEVE